MVGGLALASFALTFAALRLLVSRFARLALDRPNERSLHERPVPRTGGIAILAGALASLAFGAGELWLPISLALALAVLSFVDDLRGLATLVRLTAHLAAAGLFVWYVMSPMHPLELALLALAVGWSTNLYNFMDGSDGLAGGMALIGFGAYAIPPVISGQAALAALNPRQVRLVEQEADDSSPIPAVRRATATAASRSRSSRAGPRAPGATRSLRGTDSSAGS